MKPMPRMTLDELMGDRPNGNPCLCWEDEDIRSFARRLNKDSLSALEALNLPVEIDDIAWVLHVILEAHPNKAFYAELSEALGELTDYYPTDPYIVTRIMLQISSEEAIELVREWLLREYTETPAPEVPHLRSPED